MDTKRLLVIVLFLLIFAMAVRLPTDTDTWWHLASGKYILETGHIPFSDPFSHTMAGKGWIDHGWLAQIALYWLFQNFSYAGLGLALAAIVTGVMALVFLQGGATSRRFGNLREGCDLYLNAFVTVLAAITSSVIWVARPQMLSFALVAAFSFILNRYKLKCLALPKSQALYPGIYFIPLLFVLWVNVHGGFITGFLLLGSYIVGEVLNNLFDLPALSRRQIITLLTATAISLPACLINPNTYKMLFYPFFTVGIGALRDYIQEWSSPDFHLSYLHPFIWMLLLTVAAMAFSRRRTDFTEIGLVSLFCYMSFWAQRNIPLFAIVAAPVLMRHSSSILEEIAESAQKGPLGKLLSRQLPQGPLLTGINWGILALVASVCALKIYYPLTPQANLKAQEEGLPVAAARFIGEEAPPGEMFNSYNWGGFLIWKLYPRYRVFIDGRTDLYDDRFIREYLKVVWMDEGWEEVLERYKVNLILIESESVLAKFLKSGLAQDWKLAYEDEMASVFVRGG